MEKVIRGYFWVPEDETIKHFGEIHMSERNDKFELEMYGILPVFKDALFNINFHDELYCIHGYTSELKCVSLFGLRIINARGNFFQEDYNSISAKNCLFTLSFKQIIYSDAQCLRINNRLSKFNNINFSAQYLNILDNKSEIDSDYLQKAKDNSFMKKEGDEYSYTLKASSPTMIPFEQGSCHFYSKFNNKQWFQTNKLNIDHCAYLDFIFSDDLTYDEMIDFLIKIRQFYSITTGNPLALEQISFKDSEGVAYNLNFKGNLKSNSFTSPIIQEHRFITLSKLSKSNYLIDFFRNYDYLKLPLSHYFSYIEGEKSTPLQDVLSLVSALETIYNKKQPPLTKTETKLNKTMAEIISSYNFSPTHKRFLVESKITRKIRSYKIKDKLASLIEESPKLETLCDNSEKFVSAILDLRHYLVHEINRDNTDLSLLHNELLLRQQIVKLKVILEYHLLVMLGIDEEIVEKKIDRTMSNFVHFRN